MSKEEVAATRAQLQADGVEAAKLLASPAGAALLRYLRALWARRGLGETAEKTAYRVAMRDAVEVLEDMRKEGGA
jgi:hypothetical protein